MTTPSRWIAWAAAGGAMTLLAGCVVAPIGPPPPPRPVVVYPAPGYGPPPVVVVPAPPPRPYPYPYRRWRDRY